jgi:hypothetical protein
VEKVRYSEILRRLGVEKWTPIWAVSCRQVPYDYDNKREFVNKDFDAKIHRPMVGVGLDKK